MPINVSQFYYDKDWAARTSYRIARVRGRTKPFHARAGERDAVHGGTERARNNKKKQEDTISVCVHYLFAIHSINLQKINH